MSFSSDKNKFSETQNTWKWLFKTENLGVNMIFITRRYSVDLFNLTSLSKFHSILQEN